MEELVIKNQFYSIAYRSRAGVLTRVKGRLKNATEEEITLTSIKDNVREFRIIPIKNIVEISKYQKQTKAKRKGIYNV